MRQAFPARSSRRGLIALLQPPFGLPRSMSLLPAHSKDARCAGATGHLGEAGGRLNDGRLRDYELSIEAVYGESALVSGSPVGSAASTP